MRYRSNKRSKNCASGQRPRNTELMPRGTELGLALEPHNPACAAPTPAPACTTACGTSQWPGEAGICIRCSLRPGWNCHKSHDALTSVNGRELSPRPGWFRCGQDTQTTVSATAGSLARYFPGQEPAFICSLRTSAVGKGEKTWGPSQVSHELSG